MPRHISTGADPLFDGARRAAAGADGALVVTINYRLGPLGFLVRDATGAGGMDGLGDAALALAWVQASGARCCCCCCFLFDAPAPRVMCPGGSGQGAGAFGTCCLCVTYPPIGWRPGDSGQGPGRWHVLGSTCLPVGGRVVLTTGGSR